MPCDYRLPDKKKVTFHIRRHISAVEYPNIPGARLLWPRQQGALIEAEIVKCTCNLQHIILALLAIKRDGKNKELLHFGRVLNKHQTTADCSNTSHCHCCCRNKCRTPVPADTHIYLAVSAVLEIAQWNLWDPFVRVLTVLQPALQKSDDLYPVGWFDRLERVAETARIFFFPLLLFSKTTTFCFQEFCEFAF